MPVKRLKLPLPWGNQPDEPCDDPIAFIYSDYLDRRDCLAGYKRNPPVPCIVGERAECAWGIRSPADFYCLWRYLARCKAESIESSELASMLGVSKERIRKVLETAQEHARCNLELSDIAEDYLPRTAPPEPPAPLEVAPNPPPSQPHRARPRMRKRRKLSEMT